VLRPLSPADQSALSAGLLRWFAKAQRPYPWRTHRTPYRVWICEIMAQQTRLDTVAGYFERFVGRFPDVATLAAATEDEVLSYWSGLGYYSRARNLHAAAKVVVEQWGGVLPETVAGLASLPGIGPYTAGAIASIGFDAPEPAVDGNVFRVLTRVLDCDDPVDHAATRTALTDVARALVQGLTGDAKPSDFNQALMELGATVCTPPPLAPACLVCPLAPVCRARVTGRVEQLPVRAKKPAPKAQPLVTLAVRDATGALLLTRRLQIGTFKGLWVPPTGPTLEAVTEGLGQAGVVLSHVADEPSSSFTHVLTHRHYTVSVYAAQAALHRDPDPTRARWVRTVDDLEGLGVPVFTQKALAAASFAELESPRASRGVLREQNRAAPRRHAVPGVRKKGP
jgi:A/G-specific adenine glycosylase